MNLRGISFGNVIGASGVEGFYGGDEYRYHVLKRLGLLSFAGMGFVAKTMTLEPNPGNMEMEGDGITVRRWFPDCVHVSPRSWWRGVALNKVGLTNLGANELLARGLWQQRTKPFMLSFMSLGQTSAEKLEEMRRFVRLFKAYQSGFRAPVALQINFSCPNVGVSHDAAFVDLVSRTLSVAAELRIPLLPKFDVTLSPGEAHAISLHPACDAIVMSNTLKFGSRGVDWKREFGFLESPLEKIGKPGTGGGGASGAILLPLVEDWIKRARDIGIEKPINGGGGILCPFDAERLIAAGAKSVFIGSMAFLRPWQVQPTIRRVNKLLGGQ